MKVLILGAGGMLGHKLWQVYQDKFDTYVTARKPYSDYHKYGIFNSDKFVSGVDALDLESVTKVLASIQPDVVINCIGIIKQLPTAKDPLLSIKINALFPHQLAQLCKIADIRLIHLSTDCVFSGKDGAYTEESISDAYDLYGRTKFLGEVDYPNALTVRTSIIGRELASELSLIDWFLSNRGQNKTVKGFTQAIYTGFTTQAMAAIIADIILEHPDLHGVYHVSAEPINKYELLCQVSDAFNADIDIVPDDTVNIDRSLDSTKFRQITGFQPPSWEDMIRQLAEDKTPYDTWRSNE